MVRERKDYSSGGNMVTMGCGMKLAQVKCKGTVWGIPKNDAQFVVDIVTPRMLSSVPLMCAAQNQCPVNVIAIHMDCPRVKRSTSQ